MESTTEINTPSNTETQPSPDNQNLTATQDESNQIAAQTNEESGAEWYWSENVKGSGVMPEFLREEFKSVDQQAKAYNELVKKFGAFHKAPESYTIDDVKNDKYRITEGDENLSGFMQIAKELNMSQEGFNKIVKYFNEKIAPTFKVISDEVDPEAEKAKLGQQWEFKLKRIHNWAKSNAPDKYDVINRMAKTAEGVDMLLDLIDKNANTGNSIPDSTASTGRPPETRESAKAALAELYNYKGPDKDKKYQEVRAKYHQAIK